VGALPPLSSARKSVRDRVFTFLFPFFLAAVSRGKHLPSWSNSSLTRLTVMGKLYYCYQSACFIAQQSNIDLMHHICTLLLVRLPDSYQRAEPKPYCAGLDILFSQSHCPFQYDSSNNGGCVTKSACFCAYSVNQAKVFGDVALGR
jgi:hypothetical protein